MIGGNLGAAVQMLKVINQQGGGSQSWESTCTPTNLTLTEITGGIKLDWAEACTDEDGFEIWISIDGAAYTLLDTVAADVVTYDDLTDYAGSTVEYKVRAYKDTLYSEFSDESSITPNPLYDGNTNGWYKGDDASTLTLGAGNIVSSWRDFLSSGHNFAQGTSTYSPIWSSPGILTFDGSNDRLDMTLAMDQPITIYAVLKQITYASGDTLWSSLTSASRLLLIQDPSTPKIKLYAGGSNYGMGNNNLALDTWGIATVCYNGLNSFLKINNILGEVLTSNPGTLSPTGIKLGGNADSGAYGNVAFKELIIRKGTDTALAETTIYNYLKTKHGL